MTFLAPLPMIIAAALTVPALIALYLLKLRRRPVRVSSTVLWEDRTEDLQVNVPLRWLRNTPLLWLHLLILALFLMALGRPAVEGMGAVPPRVVIAIDRSASMNATDGEVSRLEEAKRRAGAFVDALRRAPRMPEVTVIAFAGDARVVAPPSDDRGRIRAAIDLITPTDQPGDPGAALELAGALLRRAGAGSEEEGGAEPALLLLLSDGCNPASSALTLAGAEVRYEAVGTEQPFHDNVGIVAGSAVRDYERPTLVRAFVRVQNASDRERTVALRVDLRGRRVLSTTLSVPAARTEAAEGTAGRDGLVPGEAATTLEFEDAEGGLLRISLPGGDVLASDDAYQAVLAPPVAPGVLVVHPDDRRPDPFLVDVLRELRLRSLRAVPAAEAERTIAARRGEIGVVVYDRVRPERLPQAPSLVFGAPPPSLPGVEAEAGPIGERVRFVTWRRGHPVLEYTALDTVVIAEAFALPSPGEAEGEAGLGIESLAEGPHGPLIAEVRRGGVRHLLVGFALAQSNWPVHFSFPIFVASAVDYLAGLTAEDGGSARSVSTTEAVSVAASGAVRVAGPIERRVTPPGGAADGTREVSLGVLERAGVYEIEGAGVGAEGRTIAVNLLSPVESLVFVDPAIRVAGREVPGRGEAEVGPRELWPWFVLAAAALLAVEWVLFAWKMRA